MLKHKRQEFSIPDLIGTLDVEEKFKNKGKFDGKANIDGKNKVVQHTNFKKKNGKKKGACHVCGDPDHWAPSCPNRFDKRHPEKGGKTANVVIGDTNMKDAGMVYFPLFFQYVILLTG